MAWVPQHPTIFHGSVADNLRLADPEADDDRLRWAAEATGAASFIASLPDGYATLVGEGGVRLSGGQRQLLALTRACVRDAPLVIWDEPVSHLDDEVHGVVLGAIGGMLAGRTAIVITHGAAIVPAVDRAVELRAGRIVSREHPVAPVGGARVSVVGRFAGVVRPVRGALLVAAAAGMAAAVASVLLMVAAPYLISRATVVTGFAALAVTVTAVRALAIGRAVLRYLDRYTSHAATFRVMTAVRVWLFRALEPRVPGAYRSGDLLGRAVADIDTLGGMVVRGVLPPIAASAAAVAGVVALWMIAPVLGVGLAVGLVACGIIVPLMVRAMARRPAADDLDARAALHATAAEDVAGLAELVAFGRADDLGGRLTSASTASTVARGRLARVRAGGTAAVTLVAGGTAVALLWVAFGLHGDERVAGVLLAAVPLAAIATFEALLPLGDAFGELASGRAAATRTFEVIDAPIPVEEPDSTVPVPATPSLVLDGVRFRFAPDTAWILDGLDLALAPGERLGLTGPNGAGKTTTLQLLLRFVAPVDGVYRIDDRDAGAYAADDVRARFAIVPQDPYLFNGTLRDNLLLADADADDDRIGAACERAQLGRLLGRLPDGLDTPVGEDGMRLSGGERRRLAVARVFLRDAPILLLDEPTADLDRATERDLLAEIDRFAQGRSLVMVSHRPAALDLVSRVQALRRRLCRVRSQTSGRELAMTTDVPVDLYIAAYDDPDAAREDFDD